MNNTLIINDGNYEMSKKAGDILALMLKCSKNIDIDYAPMDISNYNNIVLLFSTYESNTKENVKEYLLHVKYMLKDVKLVVVCIDRSHDKREYLDELSKIMGREADLIKYISDVQIFDKIESKMRRKKSKVNSVNDILECGYNQSEIIQVYESINKFINNPKKRMPKERLKTEIDEFIKEHEICAFAVGYKEFIRNTPMKYVYIDNNFYFITEGGIGFKGLLQNENVSIAIFNNNSVDGIQAIGKSSIVSNKSREYEDIIEKNNIEIEVVENMSININLIKVEVEEFEFTKSSFKNEGFDVKQIYNLEKRS